MAFSVHEQVRREVARCVQGNHILRVGPAANRIIATNKGTGFSTATIASMLLEAGISAAVPIEIEMPEAAGHDPALQPAGILG